MPSKLKMRAPCINMKRTESLPTTRPASLVAATTSAEATTLPVQAVPFWSIWISHIGAARASRGSDSFQVPPGASAARPTPGRKRTRPARRAQVRRSMDGSFRAEETGASTTHDLLLYHGAGRTQVAGRALLQGAQESLWESYTCRCPRPLIPATEGVS